MGTGERGEFLLWSARLNLLRLYTALVFTPVLMAIVALAIAARAAEGIPAVVLYLGAAACALLLVVGIIVVHPHMIRAAWLGAQADERGAYRLSPAPFGALTGASGWR